MTKRLRTMLGTVLVLACFLVPPTLAAMEAEAAEAVEKVLQFDTRPGASVEALVVMPQDPIATLILLEGGGGDLMLSGTKTNNRGFLTTSRRLFADHGFVVALVDAPSDVKRKRASRKISGMSGLFRTNRKHLADIEAVAARLDAEFGLPIWLVGVSRGSQSAAHVAIHSKRPFGGLVLASSMATAPDPSPAVPAMALEKITIPTLVIAHRRDGCSYTPASGAALIKDGLKHATPLKVHYVEGGKNVGKDPCNPRTFHTFHEVEKPVVDVMADFIKASLAAAASRSEQASKDGYLTRLEVEQALIGNTMTFDTRNGQPMRVFFDSEGTTHIVRQTDAGRHIRKKWWLRHNGVLCRTVGRQNAQQCTRLGRGDEPHSLVFFAPNGRRMFEATIVRGNKLAD